jgi:ribosomal protein S18 acetylase RimI-like enzyme
MHAGQIPLLQALNAQSPCLLLHSGSALLGYACVSKMNSSLLLSPPVLLQPLHSDQQAGVLRLLLTFAHEESSRCGLLGPHVLLTEESSSENIDVRSVLKLAGFQETTRLSDWRLEYCPRPPCPSDSTRQFIFRNSARVILQNHSLKQQLHELLRTILSDSSDLAALPTPSPDDLIQNWMSSDAFLILYRHPHGAPQGICCINRELPSNAPGLPHSDIRISYLGVHPASRQTGIATRLIQEVCQQIPLISQPATTNGSAPELLAPDAHNTILSVYVDRSNLPAIRLYQKSGFQLQSTMELWSRR